jgi:hypothetical protein
VQEYWQWQQQAQQRCNLLMFNLGYCKVGAIAIEQKSPTTTTTATATG